MKANSTDSRCSYRASGVAWTARVARVTHPCDGAAKID